MEACLNLPLNRVSDSEPLTSEASTRQFRLSAYDFPMSLEYCFNTSDGSICIKIIYAIDPARDKHQLIEANGVQLSFGRHGRRLLRAQYRADLSTKENLRSAFLYISNQLESKHSDIILNHGKVAGALITLVANVTRIAADAILERAEALGFFDEHIAPNSTSPH